MIQQMSLHSFLSQPLALHEPICTELATRFARVGSGQQEALNDLQARDVSEFLPSDTELIHDDGIAVLPIHGLMVKKTQVWIGWDAVAVLIGSDFWSSQIRRLAARSDVHTIILDVDSGGGQVFGTEQLGNAIYAARQSCNVIGVVNEFAASAALWAVTSADHVVINPTGAMGSLGVYRLHYDDTKLLSNIGVDKSVIYRGEYKAADERELTPELREHMQGFIDAQYSLFVDAIARNRGQSAQAVIDLWGQAQLFTGTEAVSNGLADELGTLTDVLESVQAGRSGRISTPAPAPEEDDIVPLTFTDGNLVNDKGDAVAKLADLNLSPEQLQQHCGEQIRHLTQAAVSAAIADQQTEHEAAVATAAQEATTRTLARVDEFAAALPDLPASELAAAVKGDKPVADVKASVLELRLKETEDKLAKASHKRPPFAGSGDNPTGAAADSDDTDADLKAAFAKDNDGFATFGAYKAYHAAHSAGLTR